MNDTDQSVLGDIVAALPVAVYRTSLEGRFVAGNAALVELLGAESFEQLSAIDVRSLYADPERRDSLIRRVANGEPIPVEHLELRRLDGRLLWVQVDSHGVLAADGSIAYFEGVMEDVTTLHTVDAQLQRTNRMLDTLTRMQNQYIAGGDVGDLFDALLSDLLVATESAYGFIAQVLTDDGGQFLRSWAMSDISWNDTTREMFQRFGPRGMEFHNLDTLFGRVVTGNEPIIANTPRTDPRAAGRPDGHPPLTAFMGVPIRKGDEVVGMVALANREGGYDQSMVEFLEPLAATVGSLIEAAVVDRERAEAQRRQKTDQQLYLSIVEQAADAIVTYRDGGTIVLANRAAAALLGVDDDRALIGAHLARFLPASLIRDSYARGIRALDAGETMEVGIRAVDGAVAIVEASFVRGEYDGVGMTTVIARDIGARKAIERALRTARDAAESTARAKDELLSGMSHELRTPLNAVIGLSTVLDRQLHGPLTDKQREYVQQIESSGRHLLAIITTILDLAKAEAQKLEPVLVDVDVASMVRDAHALIGELAVSKGIVVSTEVPAGLPVIRADALRARQILLNLLSNAIKFTDEGGRIGIRAARVEAGVAITVWDTGIGIAPEHLERVFDAFEQVDSSLGRRHDGTGLGLALSRRLAEAQGATLEVSSALGEGSAFTVTFSGSPPA